MDGWKIDVVQHEIIVDADPGFEHRDASFTEYHSTLNGAYNAVKRIGVVSVNRYVIDKITVSRIWIIEPPAQVVPA